jgi:dienelactone hydrolase
MTLRTHTVKLRAADGHELDGYCCEPEGEPIGGLVVVQEIFGVNAHIRAVSEGYARDGFRVIAPAMFDRVERGVELGYDAAGMSRGDRAGQAVCSPSTTCSTWARRSRGSKGSRRV